jgi:hypothetical protein
MGGDFLSTAVYQSTKRTEDKSPFAGINHEWTRMGSDKPRMTGIPRMLL